MGMSPKNARLTIMTTVKFANEHEAEFQELVDKGHSIHYMTHEFDMFLDPRAWRTWTDKTGKIAHLAMAIKSARVAKKLREKKK